MSDIFPKIKIVSDGIRCTVFFQRSIHAEPVDLSSVIRSIRYTHEAGDCAVVVLEVLVPLLDLQTDATKAAIRFLNPPPIKEVPGENDSSGSHGAI